MPRPEGAPRFPGFSRARALLLVPNDVIDFLMPQLPASAFKVYCVLLFEDYFNGADGIAISYRTLRERTGLGKSAVYHAVWLLEAGRLIDRVRQVASNGGDVANVYRILPLPADVRS